MHTMKSSPQLCCRGVTLIEVLITLLVLSIGLLGLGALQSFSLQSGQLAYQRTQATNIAYQIADEFRAYRGQATVPTAVSDRWDDLAANLLPNGTVATTGPTGDAITVTVTWSDGREVDGPDQDTVTIQTRI